MNRTINEVPRSIDIVLKISERCNLACTYCYFFEQENNSFQTNSPIFSKKNIHQLVEYIKQGVTELNLKSVRIGLHGGEPLLMPKKRFDYLCGYLREHLDEITELKLGIQTNGVLVDEEWVDIFEKHQVATGVSIDGMKESHDQYRLDHNGKPSYDKSVEGLKLLQKAKREGRIPGAGILCVANPDFDGGETVKHIVEELGGKNFNLLLPREGYDGTLWLDQDKWIRYFESAMHYWLYESELGPKGIKIRMLSNVLQAMLTDEGAELVDLYNSNQHNIITISSEGEVGTDDNLISIDNSFYGDNRTIFNSSMQDLIAGEQWQMLINAVDHVPEKCESCEWFRSCRGGMFFNRYSNKDKFNRQTVYCETMDFIHTYIAEYLLSLGEPLESISSRLEQTPFHHAKDGLNVNEQLLNTKRSQQIIFKQIS
jgi:uncharacterized protein